MNNPFIDIAAQFQVFPGSMAQMMGQAYQSFAETVVEAKDNG